jgi:hypothetical protein
MCAETCVATLVVLAVMFIVGAAPTMNTGGAALCHPHRGAHASKCRVRNPRGACCALFVHIGENARWYS